MTEKLTKIDYAGLWENFPKEIIPVTFKLAKYHLQTGGIKEAYKDLSTEEKLGIYKGTLNLMRDLLMTHMDTTAASGAVDTKAIAATPIEALYKTLMPEG